MSDDIKAIVDRVFEEDGTSIVVRSEEGDLAGWSFCPKEDGVAQSKFELRAEHILASTCHLAYQANVRMFIGSQYPLLTSTYLSHQEAFYVIPNLPVTEIIEIFEAGQRRGEYILPYEQFIQVAKIKDPGRGPPMDRRTYNDLIIRRKAPWYHIRKSLNRIWDRFQFDIISVSCKHLTARFMEPFADDKNVRACAKMIAQIKPEPDDTVTLDEIQASIGQTLTFHLRWTGWEEPLKLPWGMPGSSSRH